MLEEAAQRLIKNTLNYKPNGSSGLVEQPVYQNIPYAVSRPRPAGPSGIERGFGDDPNSNYGYPYHMRGIMSNCRSPNPSNGVQGNRDNSRMQDRHQYQEQYGDIRTGMSHLRIEESVRSRPPAGMHYRMPNSGYSRNSNLQSVQNMNPLPSPPTNWINKQLAGDSRKYTNGIYEKKQTKMVYQVKTAQPSPEDILRQQ